MELSFIACLLGLTFKEDCPDLRNSRVEDILIELKSYCCDIHVHDPMADAAEATEEYGVELKSWEQLPQAQAVVLTVAHQAYRTLQPADFKNIMEPNAVLIDVKSFLDREQFADAGINVWRL